MLLYLRTFACVPLALPLTQCCLRPIVQNAAKPVVRAPHKLNKKGKKEKMRRLAKGPMAPEGIGGAFITGRKGGLMPAAQQLQAVPEFLPVRLHRPRWALASQIALPAFNSIPIWQQFCICSPAPPLSLIPPLIS